MDVKDPPQDSELKDLMDMLDNYVPDNSVVDPNNAEDTVIDPADFAPDDKKSETTIVVDSENTTNIESSEIVDGDDNSSVINGTSVDASTINDNSTIVNNVTNTDNSEVVDGVSELTEATQNVADVVEQGNKDQEQILSSIDETLKDQFEAQERDRRKAAIINETTPFDYFVDAQNNGAAGGADNANGGGLLGGMLPPFGGGKDRDPKQDKKWKDKTKGEKFKSGLKLGAKATAAAALLALVGITAKDKFFPDGMPEWMPFVGEDEEGNSDSPISDSVAAVGLAGAGYYGAKKAGEKFFGNDVQVDDGTVKADVKDADVDTDTDATKNKADDKPKSDDKPKADTDKNADSKKAISDDTKDVDDPKSKDKWYKSLGKKFAPAAKYADDALASTGKFLGKAAGPVASLAASGFSAYSQISDINANTELTEDEKNTEIAKVAGSTVVDGAASAGGFMAGAATGAAIGSVIPVVGTAVGGVVGGLIGGFGGSMLAEATGLTEAGGEFAAAAFNTYEDISDTASKMYDEAGKVYDSTISSGKQMVSDATDAVSSYVSGLFGLTDSASSAIKDNTVKSAAVVRESTEYFNMETMEMIDPESKNPSSVGQTVSVMSNWPALFAPVLGLAGVGLQTLFDEFGSTILDGITDLTEKIGEFGEMLWDNLVNVFEGDSDTDRALEEAKKKFESNTDEESGFFSNIFGSSKPKNNIVVVPGGGSAPAPKAPQSYKQTPLVTAPDVKVDNIDTSMNVKAVDNVQVIPMSDDREFGSVVNNYYGSQSKTETKRPEMKTVSRREINKGQNNGVSLAAPSLNNTPSTVADPVLGMVNMGAL